MPPDSSAGSPGLAWRTLKNSVWGIAEFAWPLILALTATPYVVRELGADAYGLLSLVGVTLGFFSVLDLGIGGAAIRKIAALQERQDVGGVNLVMRTVVGVYALIGAAGAVLLVALTPWLVSVALSIPAEQQASAKVAFYIAAPSFAVSLIYGALVAVSRAVQRYDVATKIGVTMTTFNYVAMVVIVSLDLGVVAIVAAGLVLSLLGIPIVHMVNRRLVPGLRFEIGYDPETAKELLSFGALFLLSTLGVALLYQLDKLLIGSFIGVAAVTYYVVPGNLAQKIQGLVAAAVSVLFPVSSALFERKDSQGLQRIYSEGNRLVYMMVVMLAVPMAVFARPFLLHWMGAEIAANSSVVMMLLVATYALLASTGVPWSIANGAGRAGINATATFLIAGINIGVFLLVVDRFGVNGAAAAYLIAAAVGAPLIAGWVERAVLGLSGFRFLRLAFPAVGVGVVQAVICVLARPMAVNLLITVTLMALGVLLFPLIYWALGLMQEGDRRLISLLAQRFGR